MGGSKLDTKNQEYFYFLVRKDGKYYVAHRAGADVHKIVEWTEHPAVKKEDANGAQTNTLAIQVTTDSMHLMANGQRVKTFSKAEVYGTLPAGQAGTRSRTPAMPPTSSIAWRRRRPAGSPTGAWTW